jgi:hypothetical protein
LVLLVKKASALPIPVDNPANKVSPKAIKMVFVSTDIIFPLFIQKK